MERCRNTRSSFSNYALPACQDAKIKSRWIGSFLSSSSTISWRSRCKIEDYGAHPRNSLRTRASSRGPLSKIIWRSGRSGISWKVRRRGIHKSFVQYCSLSSEEDHLDLQIQFIGTQPEVPNVLEALCQSHLFSILYDIGEID